MPSSVRPRRIAVLVFHGAPLFETAVPLSVFGVDRSSTGGPRYDVLAVAAEGPAVTTTAGATLTAPYGLDVVPSADVVVVPTWRGPNEPPPPAVLGALQAAHDNGAMVVGLCLGAFVLAAAGLLNGRRAATHWLHAPDLAEAYPAVTVDASVLYVDEGQVLTSAGTAAGLDACLHVIRRLDGAGAASAVARRMVVAPQRAGGQAQFIEPANPADGEHELTAVMEWAVGHLREADSVGRLAGMAHMSRRTFDRRFRTATGTSPLTWLLHQRVFQAQRLLESTSRSVDQIAADVGFGSAVSLRPHFRRIVGTGPNAYRQAFGTAPGGIAHGGTATT